MFYRKLNDDEKLQQRANLLFNKTQEKYPRIGIVKTDYSLGAGMDKRDDEEEENLNEDLNEEQTVEDTSLEPEQNPNEQEKDYNEIADLFYPSMKEKEEPAEELTKQEMAETEDINTENLQDGVFTGAAAPITDENEKNKKVLEILGLNKNEDNSDYETKDNTISIKEKDYQTINGINYPKYTDNKVVQAMKNDKLQEISSKNKAEREKYLNSLGGKGYKYIIDNIDKPVFDKIKKSPLIREAIENVRMAKADSYMNTDYAKKHKVYNDYREAPKELQEYLKDKISQQIGADKLDSTKGIYIDKDSESSKSLSQYLIKNNDFCKKLKQYDNALNSKFSVNDSMPFEKGNWHFAVGKSDIRNLHINENGDYELYITDTYDFNDSATKGVAAIGRDKQEKGQFKPYFSIYHVVIPKEEVRKI